MCNICSSARHKSLSSVQTYQRDCATLFELTHRSIDSDSEKLFPWDLIFLLPTTHGRKMNGSFQFQRDLVICPNSATSTSPDLVDWYFHHFWNITGNPYDPTNLLKVMCRNQCPPVCKKKVIMTLVGENHVNKQEILREISILQNEN